MLQVKPQSVIIICMKILGIDPGMAIVGYSLIDFDGNNLSLIASGSIQTQKGVRESSRLLEIYNDITTIVENINLMFVQLKSSFSLETIQL